VYNQSIVTTLAKNAIYLHFVDQR